MLEMPSGTGKTVSLLALVISYKAVRRLAASRRTLWAHALIRQERCSEAEPGQRPCTSSTQRWAS